MVHPISPRSRIHLGIPWTSHQSQIWATCSVPLVHLGSKSLGNMGSHGTSYQSLVWGIPWTSISPDLGYMLGPSCPSRSIVPRYLEIPWYIPGLGCILKSHGRPISPRSGLYARSFIPSLSHGT